jgi:hypothetical protein
LPASDKRIFQDYFHNQETHITPAEVIRAINKMRTTAPGEDGIKLTLYRILKQELAPILAEVLNQLVQQMPEDFLMGVIIPIFKDGNPYEASNYRLITLLNTDYRIMQQILVVKIKEPLQRLICPNQSAFLPGRCITDNIWTLQLLPRYLELLQMQGYFAVCDFAKAYDKIDRQFLLRVCAEMHFPPFLLQWITQILSKTGAKVYVNGRFSHTGISFSRMPPTLPELNLR